MVRLEHLHPLAKAAVAGSVLLGVAVHAADALYEPPAKLPFLYDAMFTSLAAAHLFLAAVYLNYRQWQTPADKL